MNVDVTVNGRAWRVAVEPADQHGRFQVSIKGRQRIFDASWIDAGTLSLIRVDEGSAQGRLFDIAIQPRDAGEIDLALRGKSFRVLAIAEGKASPRVRADHVARAAEGRQPVVAPMPGRIVRVLVAAGDRVAAQQGVVVVEAMKMENELRSPKDGVVREILVREGDAVEARAVLLVIE